ncbi:MAG: SseB family protein [Clostridia bacterium]|nr:SseB family protein [Clostridia bacterium]
MGLFSRNKLTIHCDNCKKKISDYEFVWIDEHKFCQKCAAQIQGGAPNDLVQSGGVLHGQNFESYNYEMNIEDIFFVKNKGTVLCGSVKKGAVREGDTVYVGKKSFKVIGIECSGTLLKEALCGMNIGLLVDCLTPHIFKVNDVVIGEPEPVKPPSPKVPEKNEEADTISSASSKTSVLLPEEISELKKYALKFLPSKIENPADYKEVIDSLSRVIPTINISVMDFTLQNILETNSPGSLSLGDVYAMIAGEIEKWLAVTNTDKVAQTFDSLNDDDVLATWIKLDMFAFALRGAKSESIDSFCSILLDIIAKRGIKAPKSPAEEPKSEFEILRDRCFELSKNSPDSEEVKKLKADLGKMVERCDAIWVAYDEDFKNIYPYVGATGRMEVFSKEEYANKAKKYFSDCDEGHFTVVKIENKDIKKFFEDALYMGISYFNLDNGVANVDISIDSFNTYKDEVYLDRYNRIIRCSFMRYMQLLYRYNNISDSAKKDENTSFYKRIMSALLSNGTTALVNGIVYVLGPGPYTGGATLYTKDACNKLKSNHRNLDIYDEKYMLSDGDTTYGTVEGLASVETAKRPSGEEFVAVFTDKKSADKMRLEFKKFGPEYDYNIIAITFDEVVKYAMNCNGMIVDMSTYGYIIDKNDLSQILNQISNQR